jgi:transposase
MQSSLFIGIDISKTTLDVSVLTATDSNTVPYQQFTNNAKGFTQLLKWIRKHSQGIKQEN